MAIDIGDAVFRFLGDTSQLDQVFARLPAQTEAAMTAATGSVAGLGDAVGGVNFELDATAQNVPYCGEVIKDTMEVSSKVTHEARGEAALLGEAFGIHLPRHVRSFVAELPGVGTALSAAFSATAIFFVIEALAQGVEKIQEWMEHAHNVELAWDTFNTAVLTSSTSLGDKLLEANARIDDLRGNHLAALRKELELIDHQSLSDLVSQFDILAKASDAMFAQLTRSWVEFDSGSTGAKNALTDFKAQYDLLLAEGKTKEASDLLAGTLKSAKDTLTTMKEQNVESEKQAQAMRESNAMAGAAAAAFQLAGTHGDRELKSQESLIAVLQAQVNAERTINELKQARETAKTIQEGNREAKEAEALAKKQEQLYFEIAKAHDVLDKSLEKGADEVSKKETLRLTTQLKDEQAANLEQLKLLQQREQAAIAEIDGEIKHSEDMVQVKSLGYKKLFDLGIMDGTTYLAKLRQLYQTEVQDLQKMLERKQQLVILEAQNEAAQRGKFITAADAKELKAYVDLENQKQRLTDQFTVKFSKDQDQVVKASDKVFRTKANWDQFFKHLQTEALTTGQKFKLLGNEITASIGQSVEAAVSGSDSFGAAMEKILKSALASLAGEAAVHVIKEFALAASDLATIGMEWHAGLHFKAAAEWAAVGALAGIGGALMPGGGGGGGSSKAQTPAIQQNASTEAGGQPVASTNVPRLYSGAIVTQPTYAMVGDAPGGGSRAEGIFPLEGSQAQAMIRRIFGGGSGGTVENHFHCGLVVGASNMAAFARQVTRATNTGRASMTVRNTGRVTRRS